MASTISNVFDIDTPLFTSLGKYFGVYRVCEVQLVIYPFMEISGEEEYSPDGLLLYTFDGEFWGIFDAMKLSFIHWNVYGKAVKSFSVQYDVQVAPSQLVPAAAFTGANTVVDVTPKQLSTVFGGDATNRRVASRAQDTEEGPSRKRRRVENVAYTMASVTSNVFDIDTLLFTSVEYDVQVAPSQLVLAAAFTCASIVVDATSTPKQPFGNDATNRSVASGAQLKWQAPAVFGSDIPNMGEGPSRKRRRVDVSESENTPPQAHPLAREGWTRVWSCNLKETKQTCNFSSDTRDELKVHLQKAHKIMWGKAKRYDKEGSQVGAASCPWTGCSSVLAASSLSKHLLKMHMTDGSIKYICDRFPEIWNVDHFAIVNASSNSRDGNFLWFGWVFKGLEFLLIVFSFIPFFYLLDTDSTSSASQLSLQHLLHSVTNTIMFNFTTNPMVSNVEALISHQHWFFGVYDCTHTTVEIWPLDDDGVREYAANAWYDNPGNFISLSQAVLNPIGRWGIFYPRDVSNFYEILHRDLSHIPALQFVVAPPLSTQVPIEQLPLPEYEFESMTPSTSSAPTPPLIWTEPLFAADLTNISGSAASQAQEGGAAKRRKKSPGPITSYENVAPFQAGPLPPAESSAGFTSDARWAPSLSCKLRGITCDFVAKSPKEMQRHLKEMHGIKTGKNVRKTSTGEREGRQDCCWEGCEERLMPSSMTRHLMTRHIGPRQVRYKSTNTMMFNFTTKPMVSNVEALISQQHWIFGVYDCTHNTVKIWPLDDEGVREYAASACYDNPGNLVALIQAALNPNGRWGIFYPRDVSNFYEILQRDLSDQISTLQFVMAPPLSTQVPIEQVPHPEFESMTPRTSSAPTPLLIWAEPLFAADLTNISSGSPSQVQEGRSIKRSKKSPTTYENLSPFQVAPLPLPAESSYKSQVD
ncbi:hypothetical protein CVT24_003296 [Panaeolus cyanescens]|uniref:C2H2-type domain-containing protein n=1 Tax=Panaeolus cyanescens TaxID=181874 RepID=A0A409YRC2_9AGAR|nr:hypothetical protein CVT24_003296 [Panaeolus cyanescens]